MCEEYITIWKLQNEERLWDTFYRIAWLQTAAFQVYPLVRLISHLIGLIPILRKSLMFFVFLLGYIPLFIQASTLRGGGGGGGELLFFSVLVHYVTL